MIFNPITHLTVFNGQQKNGLLNGAKDGLKSVTREQTFTAYIKAAAAATKIKEKISL